MDEVYIRGLGICNVGRKGGCTTTVEIEVYTSDLDSLAQKLVPINCGGCSEDNSMALEDDYICVSCRELEGDLYFTADLSGIVRNGV